MECSEVKESIEIRGRLFGKLLKRYLTQCGNKPGGVGNEARLVAPAAMGDRREIGTIRFDENSICRNAISPLAIHFTPGERWDYSGEGYSYLQSVVTQLVGRVAPKDCKTFDDGVRVCVTDFDAYMKTNLLVPFGMTTSGYL